MVNSIERLFWVAVRGPRSRRCWIEAQRQFGYGLLALCLMVPRLAAAQASPAPVARAATPVTAASPTAPATPSGGSPAARAPGASPTPAPLAPAAAAPPSPLNPLPSEFPRNEPAANGAALDALLSRVAALRTRIAALTTALFSSKLRVELRSAGDDARLKSLRVSLDGGVVYTAPAQAFFERPEIVYEHAVAPGPHVIGIEVERHDATRPEFSTWQASRFVVVVPEKRVLFTRLELEDESSMAEDFAEDEAGEYDLRIRLQAEVGD